MLSFPEICKYHGEHDIIWLSAIFCPTFIEMHSYFIYYVRYIFWTHRYNVILWPCKTWKATSPVHQGEMIYQLAQVSIQDPLLTNTMTMIYQLEECVNNSRGNSSLNMYTVSGSIDLVTLLWKLLFEILIQLDNCYKAECDTHIGCCVLLPVVTLI